MRSIVSIATLTAVLLLGGCAGSKQRVFGTDMPSMKEIHDKKFDTGEGLGRESVQRSVKDDTADLTHYTRDANNELKVLFPLLPNPKLVMYVFPHLTLAGRPVPGYSTGFSMYETDQYALPGETGVWSQ